MREDESYLKLWAKNVTAEVWEAQQRGEMLFARCAQVACMKSACSRCLNACQKQKVEKTPVHTKRNFDVCACVWLNYYLGVGWHKIGHQAGSIKSFLFPQQTCFPLTLGLLFDAIYMAKEEGVLKGSGRTTVFHFGILRARVQPQCRRKSWQQ